MSTQSNTIIRRINQLMAQLDATSPRLGKMMNTISTTGLTFSLLTTVALGSGCDRPMDEPERAAFEGSDEIVTNLLAAGYDENDIELNEEGVVVLQGDMAINLGASRMLAGTRFRQATFPTVLSASTTTIYLRNGSCTFRKSENFVAALENARTAWNARLPFKIENWTPESNPEKTITIVKSGSLGHGEMALADLPASNSSPGAQIKVKEEAAGKDIDPKKLQHVLMHELGHAIGLAHTDWDTRWSCPDRIPEAAKESVNYETDDGDILATPSCDPGSVMNACPVPGASESEFSEWDVFAIDCVFKGTCSDVPTTTYDPAVDCKPSE